MALSCAGGLFESFPGVRQESGLPAKRDEMVLAPCPREQLQLESADDAHHAEDAIPAQTPCAIAQKIAAQNSGRVRKTSDFQEAHLFPRARNALPRGPRRKCWPVPECRTGRER